MSDVNSASASLSDLLYLICNKKKIPVYFCQVKKKKVIDEFPAKNGKLFTFMIESQYPMQGKFCNPQSITIDVNSLCLNKPKVLLSILKFNRQTRIRDIKKYTIHSIV